MKNKEISVSFFSLLAKIKCRNKYSKCINFHLKKTPNKKEANKPEGKKKTCKTTKETKQNKNPIKQKSENT